MDWEGIQMSERAVIAGIAVWFGVTLLLLVIGVNSIAAAVTGFGVCVMVVAKSDSRLE